MSMAPKTLAYIDWTIRLLLGALFIAAATMKLTGQPRMVHEFDVVGLGQEFRYVTGLMEIGGATLVLVPRSAIFGAGILLLVDIGALTAQLTRLHGDVVHTLIIAAFLSLVFYLRTKVMADSIPRMGR